MGELSYWFLAGSATAWAAGPADGAGEGAGDGNGDTVALGDAKGSAEASALGDVAGAGTTSAADSAGFGAKSCRLSSTLLAAASIVDATASLPGVSPTAMVCFPTLI